MRKLIITLFCFISILKSYGQTDKPRDVYVCDTIRGLPYIYSEYPPILKLKTTALEDLLNNSIDFSSIVNDSLITIYINVIINCDSTAEYSCLKDVPSRIKRYPMLEAQILELLETNCTWSPGKSLIESKTISKKVNEKIIHFKQYTHHPVKFRISLAFNIYNGKVKLNTKIKTI